LIVVADFNRLENPYNIGAKEEKDPHLDRPWFYLANFLDSSPQSSEQLDRQRAYRSNITALKDHFPKLICLIRTGKLQPQDIFNMDENSFIIVVSAKAKVICRAGGGHHG